MSEDLDIEDKTKKAAFSRESKMSWKEHKKRLLEGPAFRKEYDALASEYKAASFAIRRRLKGSTKN